MSLPFLLGCALPLVSILALLPRKKLPPGPINLPIIGNILFFPRTRPWHALEHAKDQYGDVLYYQGLGNSILVLNTIEAINEFLGKRGVTYSNRPPTVVIGELMQLNSALPFAPYGANWKLQRRILHTHYNPEAIRAYDHVLHQITRKLVLALRETPADFIPHLNLASGRVVMATVYGIDVPDAEDPYISHAEKTTSLITEAALPGAFMVDLLPILKVLPTWFPFASFWKVGRMGRDMVDAMITKPLLRVKEEMDTGTAPLSLAREALADDKMRAEMGEDKLLESARWVAGSMYGAGGEAVASTILVLILALCQYPEAQRRAQEELDKVIGYGRFIEIGDRPSLPYVNALLLEVLRWRPVLPVGIARCSVKDDVYKGYHIPQGTIVIPNIWAVAMEHCGSCPSDTFAPERFLDSNNDARVLMESFDYSFGFGRRVCPGKAMAENTLFLFAANILSVFTITPLPGQSPPKPEFKNSFVSSPEPFQCSFIPRRSMV